MSNYRAMKAILYRDKQGGWRWRILASNGRKLANCGEGYRRRIDCLTMLYRIMDGMGLQHFEDRETQRRIDRAGKA